MTVAIDYPGQNNIITTLYGRDECLGGNRWSIDMDSAREMTRRTWQSLFVLVNTTTPEVSAEGDEWIKGVLPRLNHVAALKDNWDEEGSPGPDPRVIDAANQLLTRLQDSLLGAVPIPFVCPIAGGGIQFEWSRSQKHLEIELLDATTIAFLKEELTPKGEVMESGEYPIEDAEITRQLLDWFTGA